MENDNNTTTNEGGNGTEWNVYSYLNEIFGSRQQPMPILLPITVIYVLLFVTGVFGNVCTCIVIIRNSKLTNRNLL